MFNIAKIASFPAVILLMVFVSRRWDVAPSGYFAYVRLPNPTTRFIFWSWPSFWIATTMFWGTRKSENSDLANVASNLSLLSLALLIRLATQWPIVVFVEHAKDPMFSSIIVHNPHLPNPGLRFVYLCGKGITALDSLIAVAAGFIALWITFIILRRMSFLKFRSFALIFVTTIVLVESVAYVGDFALVGYVTLFVNYMLIIPLIKKLEGIPASIPPAQMEDWVEGTAYRESLQSEN